MLKRGCRTSHWPAGQSDAQIACEKHLFYWLSIPSTIGANITKGQIPCAYSHAQVYARIWSDSIRLVKDDPNRDLVYA